MTGGSETVASISRKVVSTNKLLKQADFTKQSESERRKKWTWAKNIPEAIQMEEFQKSFLLTVHLSKQLALRKKEEIKREKRGRLIKIIDTCKLHGGPITEESLNLLEKLLENELISEICYFRLTSVPNIKQQKFVKDRQTEKRRLEKFTSTELKTSIKISVKPEEETSDNIEELLLAIF